MYNTCSFNLNNQPLPLNILKNHENNLNFLFWIKKEHFNKLSEDYISMLRQNASECYI